MAGAGCSLRGSWPGRVSRPDPCRGGVCAGCGGEQPGDSQAVGNAPGEHFAHGLRQRHPLRPEFAFFIRPGGRLLLGVQLLCLVYPAYLRADTRRWPQVGQRAPSRGPQLSLLGQLPLRGAEGRLTGLIAQAPRAAPAGSARPGDGTAGSAVPLLIIDRHDRHRAHVLDHFTLGPGSVWLNHGVDADLDERAVIFQPAPDYLIAQ